MNLSYPIISADDHVNPPPLIYGERLPEKWRDRAPRVEDHQGREMLVFEGKTRPFTGLEAAAGVDAKDIQILARTKQEGDFDGSDVNVDCETFAWDVDEDGDLVLEGIKADL